MQFSSHRLFRVLLPVLFFVGCANFDHDMYSGDFVRPLDVDALHTVRYRHTLISGMLSWNHSQKIVLQDQSQAVLLEGLAERGFEPVSGPADFYVVSKWRKEINPNAVEMVRFSLIVELYESAGDRLFWRAELPYIFNGGQWSEPRVRAALARAIEHFPSRVESPVDQSLAQ